jgi:rubredoxin
VEIKCLFIREGWNTGRTRRSPGHSEKHYPESVLCLGWIIRIYERRYASMMRSYICTICGHVYNPLKGEPLEGIPPETEFSALPDDWHCPVCNASKDKFIPG